MYPIPPLNLCDPWSQQLFRDPVIASNGKTYERSALMKLYNGKDPITLPDGENVENKFLEDRATKEKVEKFCKENPSFIMPISDESKKKFISAVVSHNLKEIELSVNEEPLLLSEKLFSGKTVFQHVAQESGSSNPEKLCFLLKIAKTKWSASEWYSFFENHIASNGKASVIVKAVQHHILDVNDNNFSDQNTLLHMAAKYDHKKLVKQLIIKCDADTYLTNENDKKAKEIAQPHSGIPQLIKESIQKKVFKQLFEPREKELNWKIKNLEEENSLFKKALKNAEKTTDDLKRELRNAKKNEEDLESKLIWTKNRIETLTGEQTKVVERVEKIQKAHNNFVDKAGEKGFFRARALQSSFNMERKIEKCSYDPDDFEKKDTYAVNQSWEYKYAYCLYYKPTYPFPLTSSQAEEDYKKCK